MYLTEQQFDNSGNSNQYSNVREAFELFKNTQIAFAHCEANGIQIDKEFLDRAIKETNERLDSIKNYIYEKTKVGQRIREIFGSRALLTNRNQVAVILFKGIPEAYYKGIDKDEVKKRCFNLKPVLTSAGSPIVSETELEKINNPDIADFAKHYSLYMSLHKMLKTNLEGILAGLDENAIIHPSFLLFSVISYRTSCVAKGTPILVNRNYDGNKAGVPIEELKIGDYVYCFDDELNPRLRKVLWVGKTGHKRVVRVHYRRHDGSTGYLDVTPEHKLRASDGVYVRADEIMKYENTRNSRGVGVLSVYRGNELKRDTVYVTNRDRLYEHRFVYEELVGKIPENCFVHHKDGKHWNHCVSNLEVIDGREHSRLHALENLKKPDVARRIYEGLEKAHIAPRDIKYGVEHPSNLRLSVFDVLKALARAKGNLVDVPFDFDTFKAHCVRLGIDWKRIKRRYGADGKYISRGRVLNILNDTNRTQALKSLRLGYARFYQLCCDYGIPLRTYNIGKRVCNHCIYKVEELSNPVDVYDITVDEYHNFIANEIAIKNSSEPNFQNFPNHNKELSSIVRKCFIPRGENRYLCEVDYSGAEVRVNASINQDPTLVGSIERGIDFHKAVAAKSYMLDETQVTKKLRQSVKGTYTFAAFYGSYWGAIAKGLWDNINYGGLTLEDGTPLLEHIHSKGIYKLGDIETPEKGTYGEYIYNVDQWFWGVMFKRYAQWKYETWEDYQCTGYVDLPSGFRCGGVFTRNMVTNMPAQGSAAHCLLWSFCQLTDFINKWGVYKDRYGCKLDTKICGQIHDSILLDIPEKELDYILYIANKIMTKDLREHFKWITVPMEIEADVSPKGKSWLEKEPYQISEKEVPFPYSKEEIEEINKQEVERVKKMGLED